MWWRRNKESPRNKDDTASTSNLFPNDESIRALVVGLVREGKYGPYFVSLSEQIGPESSVTCSLDPTVWVEAAWPQVNQVVVLSKLVRMQAGWRAMHGRNLRPSDELSANSS